MKRRPAKISAILVSAAMLLGMSATAFAEETQADDTYSLVTNISDVTSGGEFVIAYEYEGTYYAMTNYYGNNPITAKTIEVEDGVVTTEDLDNYTWTIASGEDGVTLLGADSGYVGYNSTAYKFSWSTSSAYEWVLTANDDGTFTFSAAEEDAERDIYFNEYGSSSVGYRYSMLKADSTSVNYQANNLQLFKLGGASESTEKVSSPGMEKAVLDENGDAVSSVTAEREESVTFTLTSSLPDYLDTYINADESYVIVFHDDLPDGLTLDEDSIVLSIGETTVASSNYSVSTDTSDGCAFELSVDLEALYDSGVITAEQISSTAAVVVSYDAVVESGIAEGTYTNVAYVSYEDTTTAEGEASVTVPKAGISTGSVKTGVFTLCGMILLCAAAVIYVSARRRKTA